MRLTEVITQRVRTKTRQGVKTPELEDRPLRVCYGHSSPGMLLIVERNEIDLYSLVEVEAGTWRGFTLTNLFPDPRGGEYADAGPYQACISGTIEQSRCTCTGFERHGRCKHIPAIFELCLCGAIPELLRRGASEQQPAEGEIAEQPVAREPEPWDYVEPFSDELPEIDGFPIEPACPDCGDTGFVWNRQTLRLENCDCTPVADEELEESLQHLPY